MSLNQKIEGATTGALAEVDSASKGVRTGSFTSGGVEALAVDGAQPGIVAGMAMLGLNDEMLLPARADRFGGLATARHAPLLHDSFEGGTVNPQRWAVTATTMAATQSSVAGLTINSGAVTTANTGYMIQSARRAMKSQRAPLQAKFRARLVRYNNSVIELGFGDAATFNGAITTGAYWQVTASGAVQPVLTYNSADITGDDVSGLVLAANYYTFDVLVDDDEATFTVQNSSTGAILSRQTINLPITAQRLFSTSQIATMVRCYNTATPPATASQLILTDVHVLALDQVQNRPWSDALATLDRGCTANPFTGAQLAAWTNSAEPANATLSNTAAGYTTLGGKFQFAAVAGAVTDFALFGFQVPVPANFVVTGVDIDTWNLGAAVATTPTLLTWALAVGSTAVSLATATVNRIGLGAQSLPVATPIGGQASRISKQFRTPLHCPAGRFIHVILRMPVGTATASQVIAGMVNIEGYFD